MKLNAVAVSSRDFAKTVAFYTVLGFHFPSYTPEEQHLEPETSPGSARLMIDKDTLIADLTGAQPQPASHSGFALQYDSAAELDAVAAKLAAAGYTLKQQPWDAPWGQRYAVATDPDGYHVDLYAQL